MDQQFDSIDSNAPAPLVFETEPDNDVLTDSIQDNDSVKQLSPSKRSEQKVSLSQYEEELTKSGDENQSSSSRGGEPYGSSQASIIPVNAEVSIKDAARSPKTSTPVRLINVAPRTDSVNCSPVHLSGTPTRSVRDVSSDTSTPSRRESRVKFIDPREVTVPVIGYEIMEQRSRFTVFKLHVQRGRHDNWFVFRRYSDFTQLQRKLRIVFPMFRFTLPPKRWFRDNFDRSFLDERVQGLQAFVDSVVCHQDVCQSTPVQQFFCFEDPPGAHDSIEESRAYCAELEQAVYSLKRDLREKDSEMELLRDELNLYKSQVEMLSKALRDKNSSNGAIQSTNDTNKVPSPANSLAECDIITTQAEHALSTQAEHSLSISVNMGSQLHSTCDVSSGQYGVSVPSLKDELAAATNFDRKDARNYSLGETG